jgi:outer membrane protein OmpA-like peptidoglycan-associated protein
MKYIFLVFFSFNLAGQNLILNPSFELLTGTIPCDNVASFTKQYSICENWQHSWAAEVYDTKTITKCKLYQKQVFEPFANPHTGNVMIGQSLGFINKNDTTSEYLYTNLKSRLKKDSLYYGEYWISPTKTGKFQFPLGLLFAADNHFKNTSWENSLTILRTKPQVFFYPDSLLEQGKWYKISGFFEATGDEKFVFIGDFLYEPKNNTKQDNFVNGIYIDDILLRGATEIEKTTYQKSNIFDKNKTYALNSINFAKNSFIPSTDAYKGLDSLVSYLLKNPKINIVITAHTDNTQTTIFNKKLSEQRANFIANYLINKSIDKNRIAAKGLGETQPKVPNTNEKNREINRRVEFILH